ncbi:MAG: MBL fold metallo-hydrolase [bacterium]|nr:MBL fold metallo-hydrolase [bacterium]MBK8129872.1 MBL fold metallo-hydrolase [bacterium]
MQLQLGLLRLDVLDDGLFELRPETFVKVTKGRNAELLDRSKYRPRIKVGFNSLLVRGEGKTVLIDPGTGDKERLAERRNYNLDWPRKVLPRLKELGVRREQIDLVVLTHLHWDHAGACTTVGHSGQLVPTFPQARVIVHERELIGARAALGTGDDGYCADDFEPLAAVNALELVTTDDARILPWLSCHWSGGHSPGHMVIQIGYPEQAKLLYLSDVLPTTAQLPLDSGMSYDQNPSELEAAKQKFLARAAADHSLILLVHAPRNKLGYLHHSASDGYRFEHRTLDQLANL